MKAVIDDTTSVAVPPIKIYLQIRKRARFGLWSVVCQPIEPIYDRIEGLGWKMFLSLSIATDSLDPFRPLVHV